MRHAGDSSTLQTQTSKEDPIFVSNLSISKLFTHMKLIYCRYYPTQHYFSHLLTALSCRIDDVEKFLSESIPPVGDKPTL